MFLETSRYLFDGLLFSSLSFPRVNRKEEEEERKKDQQEEGKKVKKKEREKEGTAEGVTYSYLPRFLPVIQCQKKEYRYRLQVNHAQGPPLHLWKKERKEEKKDEWKEVW